MNYVELIKILQKKYEIHHFNSVNYLTIIDVKLIDHTVNYWNEHILYIGSLTNLQTPPDRPIMLLYIDDINVSNLLPEGSSSSFIRSEDLSSLFNMTKNLICENLKVEATLFEIAKAALDGKNIINIINTAATLLGNALILVDINMKVLAHSTVYEIMDPLWADNIERGHYSHEFMQKVRLNKEMKGWSKQGSETQFITLPGDLQPKVVTRITQEGHLVGALIMIAHHTPISEYNLRQLPLVGKILFNTFTNGASEGIYKSYYSTILYNLLNERDVSDTLELMTMSKADFPKEMQVVVARFVRRIENRYLKRTISLELERIFPDGYPVHYKNYIAILVPLVSIKQKEELANLAECEDINIGISWSFTEILEFKMHFKQSVSSIKQAQSLGHTNQVFDYTAFSYYDLLYNYTGKIPLQNYCHPALTILKEYDKTNNTELYITLRTYLHYNKNLRATAEALFLHRNSLTYRINRINDLTGLDLNDINVIYSLIDSFRINNFLNSI